MSCIVYAKSIGVDRVCACEEQLNCFVFSLLAGGEETLRGLIMYMYMYMQLYLCHFLPLMHPDLAQHCIAVVPQFTDTCLFPTSSLHVY